MAQGPGAFEFNGTEPLPTIESASRMYKSMLDSSDGRNSSTPPSSTTQHPGPLLDAQGRFLNPRSCVTCRKRKVKCDKLHPCSNCTRAHIDCIFPTPGRAPRKPKKPVDGRDAELLARLRRLEGVVKNLGVDVGLEDSQSGPDASKEVEHNGLHNGTARDEGSNGQQGGAKAQEECPQKQRDREWEEQNKNSRFENRFGRLVVNEGRSRYVNNFFWANLSNEVEDLKGILNEESDDDPDHDSPISPANMTGHHQGWVFGFSSQSVDLLALHPIPMQIEIYWKVYKERVDPLVKVLHIPSIEPTVLAAASHLANLSKGFEALLFAMYYGAATSLSAEDCLITLGEDRGVLLARYRFAIEQALARANFLTTEEIVVLQAFVIFLICLRRNSDARVIWTLTGLIVRMAQTLGIHRDGSHFSLAPFEIEIRRRLWWQVCILDIRASEDHGCDPTIIEQSFDTKMPLNINDSDLTPSMKTLPKERQGCTDMSFCLIRFEVANTFRRLGYTPPAPPRACNEYFAGVTLEDKERWITECHEKLEEKYLRNVDMTKPIYWVTATVARLMMSKMWLMVYHPYQRQGSGSGLSEEIRDKLFITSLENMEYSVLLETEARTMKWGWLFRTYMQWHALAFILTELCKKTRGELVERAWLAVDKTRDGRFGDLNHQGDAKSGHLWKPLMRLMNKAREARSKALKEDGLFPVPASQTPPGTFLPGSTVEHLEAQRSRPRVVRAPLSQAQLARFMAPTPTYGTQPIDTTKLLQSPVLKDVGEEGDLMDTSTLPDVLQQHNNQSTETTYTGLVNEPDYSGFSLPSTTTTTSHMPMSFDQQGTPTGQSAFENGELDWANWDQLVRQFGMDIDQTPGSGQAANWGGPNWSAMGSGNVLGSMGPSEGFY